MNTNTFSGIAKKIVLEGLGKKDLLKLPGSFYTIAKEVFDEPEKPIGYDPKNTRSKPERVILVTGGLDSTTLYFKLIKRYPGLKAYYINIGQSYAQKELEALYKLNIDVEIITDKDFTPLENTGWKHIIPGRNFYFLCLVAER